MNRPLSGNDIGLGAVVVDKPLPSTIVHVLEIEADPGSKDCWRKTWAVSVPGGWIVFFHAMGPVNGDSALCSTYVPDPDHNWFAKAGGGSGTADDIEGAT